MAVDEIEVKSLYGGGAQYILTYLLTSSELHHVRPKLASLPAIPLYTQEEISPLGDDALHRNPMLEATDLDNLPSIDALLPPRSKIGSRPNLPADGGLDRGGHRGGAPAPKPKQEGDDKPTHAASGLGPILFGGAPAGGGDDSGSSGASLSSSPGWAFPVLGEGNAGGEGLPLSFQEPSKPRMSMKDRSNLAYRRKGRHSDRGRKREDNSIPSFAVPGPELAAISFEFKQPLASPPPAASNMSDIASQEISRPKGEEEVSFSFGAAAASAATAGLSEDENRVSPGSLLGLRAMFAAAVWRHGATLPTRRDPHPSPF